MPITCQSCKNMREDDEEENEDEEPIDTQLHVLEECPAFKELRNECDLNTESGLVQFFKEIVRRRLEEGLE